MKREETIPLLLKSREWDALMAFLEKTKKPKEIKQIQGALESELASLY